VAIPTAISLTLAFLDIQRIIPPNVFETLIQVVAVIFGFTTVGIFYFFDKINQLRKDWNDIYQSVLDEATNSYQKTEMRFKQLTSSKMNKESDVDDLKKQMALLHDKLADIREHQKVMTFSHFRSAVTTWMKFTMLIFGLTLSLSLYALIAPAIYDSFDERTVWYLLQIISLIFFGLYAFFRLWEFYHVTADEIDGYLIELRDLSREASKVPTS
jgi:hypothetical protein